MGVYQDCAKKVKDELTPCIVKVHCMVIIPSMQTGNDMLIKRRIICEYDYVIDNMYISGVYR